MNSSGYVRISSCFGRDLQLQRTLCSMFIRGKAIKRDNGLDSKHRFFRLESTFAAGAFLPLAPIYYPFASLSCLCVVFPNPHNS